MNFTTAVFFINRDLRAVRANYDPTEIERGAGTAKTKMFKTLDKSIAKDDLVVVQTDTRHGMTVVKVTEVDVNVDFDDATPVGWVVARLDLEKHKTTMAEEALAVEAIKRAEFRKRKAALFNSLVDDQDEIKSLPMYKNGTEPATAPPAPSSTSKSID